VDEIVLVFQVLQGNMNLFLYLFPPEFRNKSDPTVPSQVLNEAEKEFKSEWISLPPTPDKKHHQNKQKNSTSSSLCLSSWNHRIVKSLSWKRALRSPGPTTDSFIEHLCDAFISLVLYIPS